MQPTGELMTPHRNGVRWGRLGLGLLALIVVGAAGWFAAGAGSMLGPNPEATTNPGATPEHQPAGIVAEVVRPQAGGIERTVSQPGTVEPFQWEDVYAKASGFLAEQQVDVGGGVKQDVDIGTHVKAGDIIAKISVPEYEKQVERDTAQVADANAKVKQMEAHLKAAKAEHLAALASIKLARVMVKAKTAYRDYRKKQLDRIMALVQEKAVDQKLGEEQEDYYLSALESKNAADEQVNSATEHANAAAAKIDQAEADLDEAKATVGIADAELAKSKVLVGYTVIKSTYTGVVTKRSFHVGDFIKAADQGGNTPLFRVEGTDKMRVVVQVPDRDVPYVSAGDPAVIRIDALPGLVIQSTPDTKIAVSRWADAEDPATRTMRTEIDVPNKYGLRNGMYGRVTINVDGGSRNALRVPSAALVEKPGGKEVKARGKGADAQRGDADKQGKGYVRVVREGKVHFTPVEYAADNGIEIEVTKGLAPTDEVIVRTTGPVEEGTPVTATTPAAAAAR